MQKKHEFEFPRALVNPDVIARMAWRAAMDTDGEGAVIECGSYNGRTIDTIAYCLRFLPWKIDVYSADTFEGFPYMPGEKDGSKKGQGAFRPDSDSIPGLLKGRGVNPLVGRVEDTLARIKGRKFSFAFIDLDLYEPTKFCIDFFRDKILMGGIIGFHDYGNKGEWKGVTKAVDDEFADNSKWQEVFLDKRGRLKKLIFFQRV